MWKFKKFSDTQNFREINFRDFRGSKTAILAHVEALNFDFCEFLHFGKAEIYPNHEFIAPKIAKMTFFEPLTFSKIGFTENLSDRKMLKFPHCVLGA